MKLTLQAEDVHRFREIVSWVIRNPQNMSAHFIVFRGKPAIVVHRFDLAIVMPLRGRKPPRPFKIPYQRLSGIHPDSKGNVTVKIDPRKGAGRIHWTLACGFLADAPFSFRSDDFVVKDAPTEAETLKEYPSSFLDDIWRCAKPCLKTYSPYLSCVHVTPEGELRSTDGKYALGIQTPYTFDSGEKTLIRACDLFGKKPLRRNKSFRMGFNGDMVHFDFGDFHFFTKPQIDRYPKLEKTFPADDTTQCRLTLDPKDAAFLKKYLNELPGREEDDSPVTILCEYDGSVSVHGSTPWPDKTKAILLVRSKYEGDAYVLRINRKHLLQALSLGCLDFKFGKSYPFAQAENIRFCCMPLDGGALPLESECSRNPAVLLHSDQ